MSSLAVRHQTHDQPAEWQARFVKMLPAIEAHARRSFARLPRHEREEMTAEATAAAFQMFVALVRRGRANLAFPTPLAHYGCLHARAGRRVGTRFNRRDLAFRCRLERLDRFDRRTGVWREAVVEDDRTPIPDQAAFRCDFPAFLATLSRRDRRIAERLSTGESTSHVARIFRLSAARVSQLRRELCEAWQRFHGELTEPAPSAATT